MRFDRQGVQELPREIGLATIEDISRTQVSLGSPRAAFYPEASVVKPMVLKRITGLIGSIKGVAD